ncbi:hypothetical protein [Endozoicomonas sp. 4G]|uniref:hypothetical protein n=1 Tax=Endozoicomonas sp. 4G TaxID=2872754 RepID=UPI0020788547|nr:hypothetical protein [Endozoicomonas sp. 4G]
MKIATLLTMARLCFLFILSVILPLAGHCAAYSGLVSWMGWGSSSKAIDEGWAESSGEISKLSFIENNPPLLLTYDRKAVGENGKTVSELENNQFYVILDSQPGDQFNFCFRTPPASSAVHFPSPPVFKKPVTGQGVPDIQNGRIRRVASTTNKEHWQHEYTTRWRLPAGHQSLVLAIEDNDNGWVIEPECSGIVSESTDLPTSSISNRSANKKTSFVDIFYRNKQAEKDGFGHSDDGSRFSGPFAIPGASGAADNSKPFTSSGGGDFGSDDDLGNLFKKRPGGGMGPLYSFEWMSEQFSSVILLPGTDGQTVKKQIWDTRIVLKIKQGWNEQAIIISQALWDKIKAANLERSSGLFLALSRQPDNPEAVFDHYLNSNPPQPLQTEDYGRDARQAFILSPKQLRSVSVFPGHVPTGISHPGGAENSQAGSQADLNRASPASGQFQSDSGRQNQGGGSRRESGGESGEDDDGSGGSSNSGSCQNCGKAVLAYNKCKECLYRESSVLEQVPTEEQPPAIEQDRELSESGTKRADTSAIHLFKWFKTLNLKGRVRGDCFRNNNYYNFPALYKLLTQSFMSDKNTLSKFHSKWVQFSNDNFSLYHLILEVGELAQSQGIENYVEVERIVKTLAIKRDEFEHGIGLRRYRNELLNKLKNRGFISPYDQDQVFYSRPSHEQKVELINNIYQVFKETSLSLQAEPFPTRFITTVMFNSFARDVYDVYGFGIPDPKMTNEELSQIFMWGYGISGKYSFITQDNQEFLLGHTSEPLNTQSLAVAKNQDVDFRDVEAMFTALVLIRSTLGIRLIGMFPDHDDFAKDVPLEQLKLLQTFTFKARKQLVRLLKSKGTEEKDKFIQSMFLIFGMVPKELSDELLNHGSVPMAQAAAQAVAHLPYQQSETSTSQSATLESDLAQEELLFTEEQTSPENQEILQNTQDPSNQVRQDRKRRFDDVEQSD